MITRKPEKNKKVDLQDPKILDFINKGGEVEVPDIPDKPKKRPIRDNRISLYLEEDLYRNLNNKKKKYESIVGFNVSMNALVKNILKEYFEKDKK